MFRTLEVFFLGPSKEHYLMDISREARLAHTSVKENIRKLVGLGLLSQRIERKGKRKFPLYRANNENKSYRSHKKLYNLESLLESGVVEFIEESLAPKSMVLFGSYARGEDTEESDIDLFVECEGEELDLGRFEKKLHRKLELHFNKNFTSYPKELKNNIINGMVIFGYLEGFK